ncbi:uncharacterized protein LOC132751519 isoform X3 [Ruditapes philippinarum]|uniref:uncharacterized protein LOC132751519 isoform X3 n=1 Tax=Ruditapes philippinarum TaxID=129788 RepID=UPI00295BC027|nr:uncharacterized protein LOC132751519 isoform X3 [Ruditapes philippinarum]
MATGHGHSGSPENILMQGYLKKSVQTSDIIPSASKQIAKNIKQRLEPNRWYVFVVRSRVPFLEFYDKEESIFTGPPIESHNLSSFQNLSYTMGRTNTNYTFCIFLADRTIELTAPSRAHMLEWCRCLERNLRNLGLRSKNLKEDHQYTAFPVKSSYTPTRSYIDDEPPFDPAPLEPAFEEQLIAKNEASTNGDEAENHDYQDATSMRLDDNDEANSDATTLPLRPPPRLPKRNKANGQEDVFASLSTVRREEMYGNFEGFDHEMDKNEMEQFNNHADTEGNSDDSEESEKGDKKGIHRKSAEDISKNEDVEDDEDRCTSLPNLSTVQQEADTSEDSDFVSASFWLRNRMPDFQANNPPDVPQRIDSVTGMPKPKPRNCKSMNMDYLKPTLSCQRPVSPTLELLGDAPILPERNNGEGAIKFVNNSANATHAEKVVVLNNNEWHSVKNNNEWHSVKNNSDTTVKKPVSNSCDNTECEDDGLYETLAEKPKRPPKLPEGYRVVNGTNQDNVYEATWQCSSSRRRKSDDDEDDDCCSKGQEKLFVAIPDKNKSKDECNGHVEMRHNGTDTHSHKKGGVLSKIFNRKSIKEKELPERLLVTIPVDGSQKCSDGSQRCSGNSNEQTELSVEENLYSDFPTPGDEPNPTNLDSDILKLSLLENGPVPNNDKSPIELPKRNFAQHPLRSSVVDNSTRPKQNFSVSMHDPIQGFNQDAYEPMDLSKSVNSDYQGKRPPIPSPPSKIILKKFAEKDSFSEETPKAPPRRNRKTDKLTRENSGSPESPCRSPGPAASSVSPGSPPIPKKRQSVKAALSASTREPALPPRNHHDDKPAVPPPPRRGVVLRASSDASAGGARPKTIHLASRQQSINQSSAVTVMNLKQNQVDILKSEIESTGGLVKVLSKVHFLSGLALVECFSKIWIAGWDVKKFPRLYDKFHIGDQLISINDVQVTDLSFAHKLVKNVKAENIEISIRRLPNAKVFAIQRSAEGESLGIKRDGGTAEILYIDPHGLAYRHGLVNKPMSMDSSGLSNWTLTEINMRPLNLFFKDSEIERRLLAVGKDISIVVQPSDFIKDLKKQLKKLKSYKDFLIQ